MPIGGPNKIVELGATKLGKGKYNSGYRRHWIFGGVERNSNRSFVVSVPNRSPETLFPIIQQYVAAGSTIYTDKWRGYNISRQCNDYTHHTVNYLVNFIDPINGVHIQNIEKMWKKIRASIPRYGIRDHHFTHYIAEFMFKKMYKYDERIDAFFSIMSSLYPLDL